MGAWEGAGQSDDWMTPRYIFDALGERFDLDVAAPEFGPRHVPCSRWIHAGSLDREWESISLFSVEGDLLRPWKKCVQGASYRSPQIPFILAPDEIARAGSPLVAESAVAIIRHQEGGGGSSPVAPEDLSVQLSKGAPGAALSIPLIEIISRQPQLQETVCRPDAETATGRSQGTGCAGFETRSQKPSKRVNASTRKVQWERPGSGIEAASITLFVGSEEWLAHSVGPKSTGCTCSICLAIAALTASQKDLSTKTISFRYQILTVPGLFPGTSSLPVPHATFQRDGAIRVNGLATTLAMHGFPKCLPTIGIVSRPFVWANPPFGGRNGIAPWLDRFFAHGDGVALTPDRTSAPWWREQAVRADAWLFLSPKVKFERLDGSVGASPANGTALLAAGPRGTAALVRAAGVLGTLALPVGRAA